MSQDTKLIVDKNIERMQDCLQTITSITGPTGQYLMTREQQQLRELMQRMEKLLNK